MTEEFTTEEFLESLDKHMERFKNYVKSRELVSSTITTENLFCTKLIGLPSHWNFAVYGKKITIEFHHPIEEYPKKED